MRRLLSKTLFNGKNLRGKKAAAGVKPSGDVINIFKEGKDPVS